MWQEVSDLDIIRKIKENISKKTWTGANTFCYIYEKNYPDETKDRTKYNLETCNNGLFVEAFVVMVQQKRWIVKTTTRKN